MGGAYQEVFQEDIRGEKLCISPVILRQTKGRKTGGIANKKRRKGWSRYQLFPKGQVGSRGAMISYIYVWGTGSQEASGYRLSPKSEKTHI